jgi:hypothetical protein
LIQRALQDTREPRKASLSIKGAATTGNIIEVRGLAAGTSAEDVAVSSVRSDMLAAILFSR